MINFFPENADNPHQSRPIRRDGRMLALANVIEMEKRNRTSKCSEDDIGTERGSTCFHRDNICRQTRLLTKVIGWQKGSLFEPAVTVPRAVDLE